MEALVFEFIDKILSKNEMLVYIFFFVSCALQLLFPPFPSDVVLVFQGYVTTQSTAFPLATIFLNAMAGTFIGSLIVYKVGYHQGQHVFDHKLVKKYLGHGHREKAERVMNKYGSYAIFISKFIPGVNAILILLAGVFKVKSRIVYLSVFSSILIHHVLMLLLGRFLGYNLSNIKKLLATYNGIVVALVVLCIAGYLAYRYFLSRRRGTTSD